MWTQFCVHNGRTPYLEQYVDAVSPATVSHKPVWRACLRSARHVTASVKPHCGDQYDFLVDTDNGAVRMLAPDWWVDLCLIVFYNIGIVNVKVCECICVYVWQFFYAQTARPISMKFAMDYLGLKYKLFLSDFVKGRYCFCNHNRHLGGRSCKLRLKNLLKFTKQFIWPLSPSKRSFAKIQKKTYTNDK